MHEKGSPDEGAGGTVARTGWAVASCTSRTRLRNRRHSVRHSVAEGIVVTRITHRTGATYHEISRGPFKTRQNLSLPESGVKDLPGIAVRHSSVVIGRHHGGEAATRRHCSTLLQLPPRQVTLGVRLYVSEKVQIECNLTKTRTHLCDLPNQPAAKC